MSAEVGQVINGKYRVIRLIGDGGMGSVFEASHEALGSRVALKFLHPELSRTGVAKRFLQEARASARIQSPHVVRVTDVDQTAEGLAFIVLEYLEGRTLQKVYEDLYHEGRALGYADALEYAVQICEGVEAAHEAGIIHRDLKPDNVMITMSQKGTPLVKLLDFGIAKVERTDAGQTPTPGGQPRKNLTRPGVLLGTPEYMAPEQVYSAESADARADVFALGVIFFEMFAGRRPVGGDEPHQIAVSHVTGEICRLSDLAPQLPAELAAGIHKAMAPQPKDRFSTVRELREMIEPFAMALRPQNSRISSGGASWQQAAMQGGGGPSSPQLPVSAWQQQPSMGPQASMGPAAFAVTAPRPSQGGPFLPAAPQPSMPPQLANAPSMVSSVPAWGGPNAGPMSGANSGLAPVSALWPVGLPPYAPSAPPASPGWGAGRIALVVGLLLAAASGATAAIVYFNYYDEEPKRTAPVIKKPAPKPRPAPVPAPTHRPGPGNIR